MRSAGSFVVVLLVVTVAVVLVSAACGDDAKTEAPVTAPPEEDNEDTLSFAADVLPIFERRCFRCHETSLSEHQRVMTATGVCFDDDRFEEVLPFVEPGDPWRSLLFRRLLSPEPGLNFSGRSCGFPMPADRAVAPYGLEKLFPDEFAIIERWINDGAGE